jgi:type VI secretion system protein ImpJ
MQVHWHEGLFLLPHHLQRLQQGFNESLIGERSRTWNYGYGVIDARLSQDDLENMRLRFDRLHAILPRMPSCQRLISNKLSSHAVPLRFF